MIVSNTCRFILFFIVPLVVIIISTILFMNQYVYSSVLALLFIPISRFMMIGSLRQRIRNTLPFLAFIIYVMIGLEFGIWDNAQLIFLSIPFISLMLNPKRHTFQYAIMIISFVVILINIYSNVTVFIGYRILVILLIYIVFYPPVVYHAFKNLFNK